MKSIIGNIKDGDLQNWVVAEFADSQWQGVAELLKVLPNLSSRNAPLVMSVNAYREDLVSTKTGFEIECPDMFAALHGHKTSDRVRALIREVLRNDSHLDDGHLDRLINDVGGNIQPGTMDDFLTSGWYTETSGTKYADGKPLSIYFTRKARHILELHIERKDILEAGVSAPIIHDRDRVGQLRCGGIPFSCLGKDEKFQKM